MTGFGACAGLRPLLWGASLLAAWPVLASAQNAPAPQPPAERTLEQQFQDPPQSARPRVWWHWMNGNVTKDGIAKDMAWMKRVGIGGLQNFDANLQTPQGVEKRLVYMQPDWKDAFRFTAREADRLGLELAIAASPGWSETGGPWVPPGDGMKKLVWSETQITGGRRFTGELAAPPTTTGPFQTAKDPANLEEAMSGAKPPAPPQFYADARVLAFPVDRTAPLAVPTITGPDGKPVDSSAMSDSDLETMVSIPKSGKDPAITFAYSKPQTIRSASIYLPGAGNVILGTNLGPRLEASDDGKIWRAMAEMHSSGAPATASFAPVTARWFRVVFGTAKGNGFSLGGMAPGVDLTPLGGGANFAMPSTPSINIGDLRLSGEARVDAFEAKAGYAIEPDYYAMSKGVADEAGLDPAKVIDITDRMTSNGTLDWTPPKGFWRVLRLGYSLTGKTNHPATREATGLEVDKLDGEAVKRYLDHYIGMYRDAAGADMVGGRGVRAILTDSTEVGPANWTPRMVERFKAARGYDPTPWLPALTGVLVGSRAQSDKFLYDYRRTLAELISSDHYGTVADVAHANDLIVYGEALEDRRPSLGDDMSMRSHADIPMAAMWTHDRTAGPRVSYLADIKGAASVAHIYGQNLVAAESLTAFMAPWAFGPADLKRVIDLEFVLGVNRPVIHTSVHQPVDEKKPGFSLWIFGQYFNRHDAWAELARPWVDYISRNSLMLQQGRNVADVGYFYGEEAPLTGLYGFSKIADAPKANAYDFISADALSSMLQNDGDELVAPGGARYKALYLGGSSRRMTLGALRKIADLAQRGATIIGPRPEESPSLAGDAAEWSSLVARLWAGNAVTSVGKGRIIASTDIDAALARIGVASDFDYSGGQNREDLPFIHRRLGDGDSYFVVNRRDAPVSVEARFRITGKAPELWHAETGTSEPVSYEIRDGFTVVPLQLGADESVHVVFRKRAVSQSLTVAPAAAVQLAAIAGPWTVSFQTGRGAPASTTMASLAPLNENSDPGIKYFSGEATYAREFTAPRAWKPGRPLWLDLGEAREVAEVTVNGKVAGNSWHAPYRINIGGFVKSGRNSLSIRVANLWVNRIIGDAQPGATKITWFTGPGYRKDAPLRRSGLIGPVTLLGSAFKR
ncbi:MAG: glycosyl hydrolase [Novosphingobium sp.]